LAQPRLMASPGFSRIIVQRLPPFLFHKVRNFTLCPRPLLEFPYRVSPCFCVLAIPAPSFLFPFKRPSSRPPFIFFHYFAAAPPPLKIPSPNTHFWGVFCRAALFTGPHLRRAWVVFFFSLVFPPFIFLILRFFCFFRLLSRLATLRLLFPFQTGPPERPNGNVAFFG